jgi:biotin carboxyl carrier protein
MRSALIEEDRLLSPAFGEWFPEVGEGHPLQPGLRLGRLRRAGAWLDVVAPEATFGVLAEPAKRGTWLQAGEALGRMGEGSRAEGAGAPASATSGGPPPGTTVVRAETDGTVYLRPDPAAPPFVSVGDAVGAHATLALVEVMKTFSPVRSPIEGRVTRVLVTQGASVQEGAPLFWVGPSQA